MQEVVLQVADVRQVVEPADVLALRLHRLVHRPRAGGPAQYDVGRLPARLVQLEPCRDVGQRDVLLLVREVTVRVL